MFVIYARILIFMILFSNGFSNVITTHQNPTLDDLLDSLMDLMKFFSKRYDKLNVDGLFGVRMAQGEMIRSLNKLSNGEYSSAIITDETKEKFEKIRDLAEKSCINALPEVKKQNEKYFNLFLPVINKPWKVFEFKAQRLKKLGGKYLPNNTTQESEMTLSEGVSDKCMESLIGVEGKTCDVNKCWHVMTTLGTTLYFTTHQILYFSLGLQFGCQSHFEQKISEGGLEKVFQRLCYSVIFQMDAMFRHGTVGSTFQDIFMESGVVCASTGFMDALNITWLKEVMSWQDKTLGCFKENYDEDDDFEAQQLRFMKRLGKQKNEWRKRNLLFDLEMGDSCSAHKSGVAAGYLAVHVRLFLEQEIVRHLLPSGIQHLYLQRNNETLGLSYLYFASLVILGLFVFAIIMNHRVRSRLLRMIFKQ